MDDVTSAELVARWRQGDQEAATALFQRYFVQLRGLARRLLSAKFAARLDAEDVLQSVYRSFFAGVREDRYVLERSGDLWRLLASITLHKVRHQVARHTAAKRSVRREQTATEDAGRTGPDPAVLAREPSPAEAVAVVEELECVLRDLSPLHRGMVEWRLQGYSVPEIAAHADRSERLVRLVLEQVRTRLRERDRALAES